MNSTDGLAAIPWGLYREISHDADGLRVDVVIAMAGKALLVLRLDEPPEG